MKFIIAAFAFLAAVCRAGFIVPPNLGDGVWSWAKDSTGNTLGEPTLLAAINKTAPAPHHPHSAKVRRQSLPNPSVSCNSYSINAADFECAWNAFDNYVGAYYNIPSNAAFWVTCNSAIAYMCNYAGAQPAANFEYDESVQLENIACSSRAGWVFISAWNKAYGRDNAGAHICF